MPPLAIIYPSGNSTSLSILPHKSTPPAPVIISLLLSKLSRVCRHLSKVPQTEDSSPPGYQSNYLPIGGMAYAKKTLWPCGCHCGVQAHFSRVATSLPQNAFCAIVATGVSACCLMPKIRSRHGLVSASPFPLKDSPQQISPLHFLVFHDGP